MKELDVWIKNVLLHKLKKKIILAVSMLTQMLLLPAIIINLSQERFKFLKGSDHVILKC